MTLQPKAKIGIPSHNPCQIAEVSKLWRGLPEYGITFNENQKK